METLNQNVLNEFMLNLKKIKFPNKIQEIKLEYNAEEECPFIYLAIIKIKKSQRNLGYGSAVMSEIIKLADQHQLEIRLYATNIFGAELKRLYGFYRKHGFVLIKHNNDGKFVYRPVKKHK